MLDRTLDKTPTPVRLPVKTQARMQQEEPLMVILIPTPTAAEAAPTTTTETDAPDARGTSTTVPCKPLSYVERNGLSLRVGMYIALLC
jgi:hypothetical protein